MEHTGLLFLFTCQTTKSFNFSRSGVNVRAHLLRKNYSRNFSSIRSAPYMLLYTESVADQPDHFTDAFVRRNVVYGYDVTTLTSESFTRRHFV